MQSAGTEQKVIDQKALISLLSSGAVTAVRIVGISGRWNVAVKVGDGSELFLVSQRSKQGEARVFRNLETAVAFLFDMGISTMNINVMDSGAEKSTRPDRSAAMKKVHEAAAYDRWFREQVVAAQNSARPALTLDQSNASLAARKAAKINKMK